MAEVNYFFFFFKEYSTKFTHTHKLSANHI